MGTPFGLPFGSPNPWKSGKMRPKSRLNLKRFSKGHPEQYLEHFWRSQRSKIEENPCFLRQNLFQNWCDFFCFLALFFQTFLDGFLVWFRFSRCERFLKNVLGSMVFTVFSAQSHFVQTLFSQSFSFKFPSKFRLFFVLIFIENLKKLATKSALRLISHLEALFSSFWLTFSDF